MAGQQNQDGKDLSQNGYHETPYEDQTWEFVGEFKGEMEFAPAEFEVLGSKEHVTDPMFADFGGRPAPSPRRWHLPETDRRTPDTHGQNFDAELAQVKAAHQLELARVREEALEEGRISALQEAVERQQTQLEELRKKLSQVLEDLNRQLDERAVNFEKRAVDLAVQISGKILHTAVEINPEYVLEVIHEAMSQCGTAAIRRVRVSPEDMEFISLVGIEKYVKEFDGTWRFEADATVRAGCIVDTSAGEVDFQLDKAWERMAAKIVQVSK